MTYTIQNEKLTAEISSLGAELKRLVSKDGIEYLCPPEKRNWDGSAPILFPNTGAVNENYWIIQGETFPCYQHGFAKKSAFDLVDQQADRLRFMLGWNEETLKAYPFRFELLVTYQLRGSTLHVEAEVVNRDAIPLYFSLGFHPGFTCPILSHERIEDYYISFDKAAAASRLQLENGLVAGIQKNYWDSEEKIRLTDTFFDNGSYSMIDMDARRVTLSTPLSSRYVEIDLGNYPNLVLWAPKDKEITNICIEPWYGVPDSVDSDHKIETKPFTVLVPPDQSKALHFSITVN